METSYHGDDPALKSDLDRLFAQVKSLKDQVENLTAMVEMLLPSDQAMTAPQLLSKRMLRL